MKQTLLAHALKFVKRIPNAGDVIIKKGAYTVSVATRKELLTVYRMRFECFNKEYLGITDDSTGYDVNKFDIRAEYLLLKKDGQIIGTYRVITGTKAKQFSFTESFNFASFDDLPMPIMELSRACITKEHRGSAIAIMLLWRGVIELAKRRGISLLVGRASLPGRDRALANGLLQRFDGLGQMNAELEAIPFEDPLRGFTDSKTATSDDVPPLIKGYLKIGAKIVGRPSYDKELQCFDYFVALDLRDLTERFAA